MRYHLGQANIEHALDHAVSTLAGKREKDLEHRTYQFYEEDIQHLYRPGALRAIEKHRADGHRLVLLTSSSEYLSEATRKQLHLDGVLCNRFDVDKEGYFTGDLVKPACYGEGKLVYAKQYLSDTKFGLEDCYFYTDSISDLPVLEAVGFPKIVAPDRKLRKEALSRGWPILDWSRE